MGAIYAAVQWFNPAAWLLSSSLQATAEEAADNEVLAAGISPSTYAKELMSFAAQSSVWPIAATGLVRPGRLAKRLKSLLAAERNRNHAPLRLSVSSGVAFGVIGLGFASYSPAIADVAQGDTASPPKNYSHPDKFADGSKPKIIFIGPGSSSAFPTWLLDGHVVNENLPKKYGFGFGGSAGGPNTRAVAVGLTLEVTKEDGSPVLTTADNFPVRLGGVTFNGASSSIGTDPSSTKTATLCRSYFVPQKLEDGRFGNWPRNWEVRKGRSKRCR